MKGLFFVLLVGLFLSVAQAQDTVFVIMAPPPTNAEVTNPPPTQVQVIEVQTASPQAEQPATQKPTRRRSGFYLNGAFGLDYSYLYYDHRYYNDKTEYDGTGVGATAELTMGILIREFLGIHGTFEIGSIDGKYECHECGSFDDEMEVSYFVGGPGITIYPFRRPDSFMAGTFIGAKILMGVIGLTIPDYYSSWKNSNTKDYFAFAFNLELGKDFKVGNRMFLGFGIRYQLLAIGSGDDMAGEEDYEDYYHHNHMVNSVQLLFHIGRK
ncbi:MAG: hypothetical protein IKC23_04160 [Fibrobacter sp.]|nr:hypothetical protein [Fibrobacter sp.]